MLRLSAITLAFVLHCSTFSPVLTDLFSSSSDGSFLTVLITAVVSGPNRTELSSLMGVRCFTV